MFDLIFQFEKERVNASFKKKWAGDITFTVHYTGN